MDEAWEIKRPVLLLTVGVIGLWRACHVHAPTDARRRYTLKYR